MCTECDTAFPVLLTVSVFKFTVPKLFRLSKLLEKKN